MTVLHFWTDEATVADGAMYGGRVHPASALAEYVMDTVNLGLEPGSKVSWEDMITRTPWMSKRLHGMTTGQEQTVRRQALPMPGESSELEVLSVKLYTEYCKKFAVTRRRKKSAWKGRNFTAALEEGGEGLDPKQVKAVPAQVLGTQIGTPRKYPPNQSREDQASPAVPLSPTSC